MRFDERIRDDELSNYMILSATNNTSIRLYYLFHRIEKSLAEQKETLYTQFFKLIFAAISGFLAILNLMTFFFKIDMLIFTITATVIALLTLLFFYIKRKPEQRIKEIDRPIKMAIHLDLIIRKAQELLYLNKIKESSEGVRKTMIEYLIEDCKTILKDSLRIVDDLLNEMRRLGVMERELASIHIDEPFVIRRLEFGRKVLLEIKE